MCRVSKGYGIWDYHVAWVQSTAQSDVAQSDGRKLLPNGEQHKWDWLSNTSPRAGRRRRRLVHKCGDPFSHTQLSNSRLLSPCGCLDIKTLSLYSSCVTEVPSRVRFFVLSPEHEGSILREMFSAMVPHHHHVTVASGNDNSQASFIPVWH